jgi:hypothetical protein
VWGFEGGNSDTPDAAKVSQRKENEKWEKTWAEGKEVPEGKPGVKGPDKVEKEKLLLDAKREAAKMAGWEKTHPDPLSGPEEKIGQMTKEEVAAKIEGVSRRNNWDPLTEKIATCLLANMLRSGMDGAAFNLIMEDLGGSASERKGNKTTNEYVANEMRKLVDTNMGEIERYVAKLAKRSEDETKLARRE